MEEGALEENSSISTSRAERRPKGVFELHHPLAFVSTFSQLLEDWTEDNARTREPVVYPR
ncbi:hypothetical protein PanWU01x14_249280 [Parasponia andersonii]|uniref:Uncharacterized protein n=1 Tax=Parasponia andersonii TaxID=3476 RepID=A0A2P5BD76_PARAD|nr:hypothetical protein PanWU01x14_249280 [Parasponia andersonii]